MNLILSTLFIITCGTLNSQQAQARVLTSPATDSQFSILPDGQRLQDIRVNGSSLSLSLGSGGDFTEKKTLQYLAIKQETLSNPNSKTHWALMDLDRHQLIASSLNANDKIFGASSSKIFVGGGLLDQQRGQLQKRQMQLLANMLVVSSNEAWIALQSEIGHGNADDGRRYIANFTKRLGLEQTRGYQGYLGSIHGNELTALETVEYLYQIYNDEFQGAETLWKIMHTCRTGADRGRKYFPSNIYVGAKTGTYDGPTEDPISGGNINANIRNHVMTYNLNGTQYGLVILSNSGSDEEVALLAGGLLRGL